MGFIRCRPIIADQADDVRSSGAGHAALSSLSAPRTQLFWNCDVPGGAAHCNRRYRWLRRLCFPNVSTGSSDECPAVGSFPDIGGRNRDVRAGIAPLYAIEAFVHVALDHSELAAIDSDFVVGATLLHALIMDADRHRALVRDPPVHLEPEQPSDDHSRHRDDPNS